MVMVLRKYEVGSQIRAKDLLSHALVGKEEDYRRPSHRNTGGEQSTRNAHRRKCKFFVLDFKVEAQEQGQARRTRSQRRQSS